MSGGYFDYQDYNLKEFADKIDQIIYSNQDNELDEWGQAKGRFYKPETIAEYKKAIEYLKLAAIYCHRIDWLESGDDEENTFHEQLAEDLKDV